MELYKKHQKNHKLSNNNQPFAANLRLIFSFRLFDIWLFVPFENRLFIRRRTKQKLSFQHNYEPLNDF